MTGRYKIKIQQY